MRFGVMFDFRNPDPGANPMRSSIRLSWTRSLGSTN